MIHPFLQSFDQRAADNNRIGQLRHACGRVRVVDAEANPERQAGFAANRLEPAPHLVDIEVGGACDPT